MSQVRKNYSGVNAITSTFDLTIYWDIREKEEKKSGELLIAPGNKFRVTLGKEAFISDGVTFWQYSEKNSQVIIRHFSDIDVSSLPSKFLSSFLSNRTFTEKQKGGGTVEVVWNSGGSGNASAKANAAGAIDDYTSITAIIEEKTGIIKTLKLTDKNDNIHTYTFKKTTFDKPPKNDIFQFKAPKGVDVQDMRDGGDGSK